MGNVVHIAISTTSPILIQSEAYIIQWNWKNLGWGYQWQFWPMAVEGSVWETFLKRVFILFGTTEMTQIW